MIPEEVSEGVLRCGDKYYTMNLLPGQSHHGEELKEIDGFEYRHWEPHRSKLGAYLELEGGLPVKADMNILYLGAGDGTTTSYLSDVLTQGKIFAVELSDKPYRHLLTLSEKRKNIFPILGDARHPEKYRDIVPTVDFLYQDIAQRDQAEIFIKNLPYLRHGCRGLFVVKARSVHVSRKAMGIYRDMEDKLKDEGVKVLRRTDIGRRQKDHAVLLVER